MRRRINPHAPNLSARSAPRMSGREKCHPQDFLGPTGLPLTSTSTGTAGAVDAGRRYPSKASVEGARLDLASDRGGFGVEVGGDLRGDFDRPRGIESQLLPFSPTPTFSTLKSTRWLRPSPTYGAAVLQAIAPAVKVELAVIEFHVTGQGRRARRRCRESRSRR